MEDRITKTQSEIKALKEVLSVYRHSDKYKSVLTENGINKEEYSNNSAVVREIENIIREKVNYKRLLLMQD